MDKSQLTNLIIKPLLRLIPHGMGKRSVLAIQMIIAHESKRGEYISQLHGGPAGGMIQMERVTHTSTWRYGATCFDNALLCGIITAEEHKSQKVPDFDRLLYDLRYNIFMARQRLFMKPEALPHGVKNMARYLKKHGNSTMGAADELSYYNDYILWKSYG